jgi:hypothetical protein
VVGKQSPAVETGTWAASVVLGVWAAVVGEVEEMFASGRSSMGPMLEMVVEEVEGLAVEMKIRTGSSSARLSRTR